MVVFEALTWEARDSDGEYVVSIFGRSANGDSVSVSTAFKPYFFVKLAKNASDLSVHSLFEKIKKACSENAPISFELLRSKDLWGFQNNELKPFMKLNFMTWAAMRFCDNKLRRVLPGEDRVLKVFESNVEPLLRCMHRSGIQSTGWLETGDCCVRSHLNRCKIDLFCNDWRTLKPVARDDIAPFIVASFDIETNSSTGKFPDPNIPGDACFQIAVTLKKVGHKEIYEKVCLCYKKTDGDNVVSFDTERDLLIAFRDYIVNHDVDIMTGWNIFGFDLEFLYVRASLNGCLGEFSDISKIKNHDCEMVYKKLSSNALGDNTLKLFPMPGRYVFDMFHDVKREHKLDSYSLNFVSEKFLGDRKLDMSPKEMFRRFEKGDPIELGEVADYCIKDTVLPHMLMDKLCNLLNLLEMAKATWVPISYLTERGQQIKVFSQMTRKAREIGFMVPTIRWGQVASETYEGATVLDAQTGAYYTPITALDFEGLYPSIMIAHNLCYSTLVMDEKYAHIPGVTYETFGTHKFAQNVSSLLPAILIELKQFRKKAKQDMAAATGDMKKVYNGKQLAYKISMNSVYGFTGAGKGILPCVPIAATVTMKGRSMIEETKAYVEANFPGSKVRYGDTDSVMVEFDVQGRTGQDAIAYSWELGERAAEECTALFKKPNNLELEKVYYPYFLYSKKRYAAKLWTKNKNGDMQMDYIDVKGLQLVRRDNIPFVREVCKELLDVILESNNPEGAKRMAHSRAVELLDGRVPMDKLILSQKLADAGSYKSSDKDGDGKKIQSKDYERVNLPHVSVVRKIRNREPGSEPQSGDRVQFVLIKTDIKNAKQFEIAEDPKWVASNSIALDYEYYFTNKFMNPVCDLLEPLVENPKEAIFGDLLAPKKRSKGKQTDLRDIFKKFEDKQKTLDTSK
jgi:DNA polymerase delta subunit 1